MSRPNPREVVTTKALFVWGAAVACYIVAVLGRTSFGVAGVDAIARFEVDASRIAVFTSVQIGVYALCQVPMGLLIDKFGPRKLLIAGALIMAAGQITLGLTTNYWVAIGARVLIGAGDATAFLSVMRLLPYWFPLKKTPVYTQLTSALGQLGQFISAVPFLWLLNTSGWTVAFTSLGAVALLVAIAAFTAVQDVADGETPPADKNAQAASTARVPLSSALKMVLTSPICWQAFFTHGVSMLFMIVFGLLWGVPLMTLGMGLSSATAGLVLMINTAVAIMAGPIMGLVSGCAGPRRDIVVMVCTSIHIGSWLFFLSSPDPRGLTAIILLNIVMAFMTTTANYGFDQIREQFPNSVVATGTGFGNMGGFIFGMISAQLVGLLLDYSSAGLAYEWEDFRLAWLAVFAVWGVGMVGMVVTHFMTKRGGGRQVVVVDEKAPEDP